MIEAFIMHPDWRIMEQYIEEHFANSTSIESINTDNPSTTVHAEVLACKKIDADIKGLKKAFEVARRNLNSKKVTYE